MHSGGFEFTELRYTRLEDKLIRHRGDRAVNATPAVEQHKTVATGEEKKEFDTRYDTAET